MKSNDASRPSIFFRPVLALEPPKLTTAPICHRSSSPFQFKLSSWCFSGLRPLCQKAAPAITGLNQVVVSVESGQCIPECAGDLSGNMGAGGLIVRMLEKAGRWLVIWGGPTFVVMMIVACYYACLFVALPARDDYDPVFWSILGNYIAFMVVVNLYLFHYFSKFNCVSHWQRQSCVADLCRNAAEEQEPLIPEVDHGVVVRIDNDERRTTNGKFCVRCNREAPLRSHHCPLCDMCVLRKDHHCFITGGCVGLGNQRFFITFLFWIVVALAIVVRYFGEHLISLDETFFPWGWTRLFGPFAILQWSLNFTDIETAASASLLCFCAASLLAASGFLGMQIYYTYYGYTMFEYHVMRDSFEGDGENVGERFRLVFGKHWYLNFLVPMVWEMPVLTPQIATNLFQIRSKLL